jgi:hypothetical protein
MLGYAIFFIQLSKANLSLEFYCSLLDLLFNQKPFHAEIDELSTSDKSGARDEYGI